MDKENKYKEIARIAQGVLIEILGYNIPAIESEEVRGIEQQLNNDPEHLRNLAACAYAEISFLVRQIDNENNDWKDAARETMINAFCEGHLTFGCRTDKVCRERCALLQQFLARFDKM